MEAPVIIVLDEVQDNVFDGGGHPSSSEICTAAAASDAVAEDDEGVDDDDDDEEEVEEAEEEEEVQCYTFSPDVLASGDMVDVSSNCLDMMQGLSEAAVELVRPPSRPIKTPIKNLPSVVIHSASNTPTTKKKKFLLKKPKRSKSFHTSSVHVSKEQQPLPADNNSVSKRVVVPQLRLPSEEDQEQQQHSSSSQFSTTSNPSLEVDDSYASEQQASAEIEALEQAALLKKQPRKRRKSLVNLLFPTKNQPATPSSTAETPSTPTVTSSENSNKSNKHNLQLLSPTPLTDSNSLTPTSAAAGGQRLHFRRLSEIICRNKPTTSAEVKSKDDCFEVTNKNDHQPPPSTPSSSQFLKQLFPYRRRRSSVNHLDNTVEFHEVKKESIEATRRRMSSFPPSDGDESTIMLEKIHYLSILEGDELMRASTPVSESMSPFKLLKKNLRSTGGCFGGGGHQASASDSFKWKSSMDVNSNSNDVMSEKEDKENQKNFLNPSLRFSDRRCSTPLIAELNALRTAELQRDKKANSSASNSLDRPGVVVFPNRKVEDVPGIFIPKKSASKDSEDGDLGSRISQFLGVKEDPLRRRRHSLSDPALLQQPRDLTTSNSSPRPIWANLKPRSPYASSQELFVPMLPRY